MKISPDQHQQIDHFPLAGILAKDRRIAGRISLRAFLREDIQTIRQTLADIGMAVGEIERRLHSLGAVADDVGVLETRETA
jgi:hypothetical protein